jgi:flagellin-like hook-associated protein FlgL
MSDITLSAGVRQNLLSLQNTASLMSVTQNRLATGKKVNTALDNPASYFTSQSLNNRANDLSDLLDSIGQAQQTLSAANQGITSLTSLVNSAKSIAKQAQQSATPTATYSLAITGNTAIADDSTQLTGTNTFASQVGSFTASQKSSYTIDASDLSGAADGDTLTLSNGTTSVTLEDDSGGDGVASGHIGFTDAASLKTALQNAFGASNVTGTTSLSVTGTDYTTSFSAASGSASLTGLVSNANAADGSKLTLTSGGATSTFRYVASGASTSSGTFTTLADLEAAINADANVGNASTTTLNGKIHASDDGSGNLVLGSTGGIFSGGSVGTALGAGSSATTNFNSTLSSITGILSITVGNGAAQTVDFGTVKTKAALTTALAGITGVGASINGSGDVALTSSTSDNVTISGTGTSATGLFAGANLGVNTPSQSAGSSSAVRSGLQSQYNDLLSQIDQLASDSSYNGINLLGGDNLKVVFNEGGTSSLTISGVNFSSTGLGLSTLSGTEFQSNSSIDGVIGNLDSALTSLRSQASSFGSTLTTVQTRQDFTKNLITTLQTGSDNLVLADTNEEGANLLALQTRQQLSTTALSLSAQQDQAVLRLFG